MVKYETAQEYINSLSPIEKERILKLKSIILEVLPNTKEVMGYGVPAYTLKENAKLNEKIMIAAYKNHVGLYPHPDTIIAFKDQLKPYKTLKGTVQFSYKEDLPVHLIKEMVLYRYNKVNND